MHITLSRQDKISVAITFGYVFFIPFFGFILGLVGNIFRVPKFTWRVKLIVWGVAWFAPFMVGAIMAKPSPSNAFQIFILIPVALLYGGIGTAAYLGVLSKMDV